MLLAVILCACSKNEPSSETVDRERFESVYIELLDSAQGIRSSPSDSALSPVAEKILRRHEITGEQFRATVRHYNSDAEKWKDFYETIVQRIAKRSEKQPAK
jgi:hypothetical protein